MLLKIVYMSCLQIRAIVETVQRNTCAPIILTLGNENNGEDKPRHC